MRNRKDEDAELGRGTLSPSRTYSAEAPRARSPLYALSSSPSAEPWSSIFPSDQLNFLTTAGVVCPRKLYQPLCG